ncbi:hypothetical protein [Microbacterium aureliae]
MTSTLRTLAAAAAAAALLTLAACSPSPSPQTTSSPAAAPSAEGECAGVAVVVETGDLEAEDSPAGAWCVPADEPIIAADALAAADVATEGTDEYGDQVVCRVNGVPAEDQAIVAEDGTEYFEKCTTMPAAFAYWSVWVKPAGGEWDYAQEGLSTLELEPGDAVELLFTLNGEPAAPTA